jgi:hypothetical protein
MRANPGLTYTNFPNRKKKTTCVPNKTECAKIDMRFLTVRSICASTVSSSQVADATMLRKAVKATHIDGMAMKALN